MIAGVGVVGLSWNCKCCFLGFASISAVLPCGVLFCCMTWLLLLLLLLLVCCAVEIAAVDFCSSRSACIGAVVVLCLPPCVIWVLLPIVRVLLWLCVLRVLCS